MIDSAQSPAVVFENVSFRYSERCEWIINNMNFSITPGEWVSIVGGNGSGKSTVIKLMNGLLKPTLGRVLVFGEQLQPANMHHIRQKVGVVFQNPDEQTVGITVEEDIAFGLQNLMIHRDEMISRVDRVISLLQLEQLRKRSIRTLSGGQKQLVAIAGILVMHPKAIVFDEASSMLDPHHAVKLQSVMSDLHREGLTVIHATHDPEDIVKADRILVLNQGNLAFEGVFPDLIEQSDILEAAGTLPPFAVRFKKALGSRGMELPGGFQTEKELAKTIWESILTM